METEDIPETLEPFDRSGTLTGRSSNRLRYEAEVAVFRKKHGNLEAIRRRLGLSRRKLSHLLMVDPSAWTRWSKDESRVPPHVYKLLEFFLEDADFAANRTMPGIPSIREQVLQEKLEQLHREIEGLKARRSVEVTRIVALMTAWFTLALLLIWAK